MSRAYEWEEDEDEDIRYSFNGAYNTNQQPESYDNYLKDLGLKDINKGGQLVL